MTSLFQEYEQRRTIRTNPESLIGKQFCWGCDMDDPFVIKGVLVIDGVKYIEYRYITNDYSKNHLNIDDFMASNPIPYIGKNA
jgi:hypothetical protein